MADKRTGMPLPAGILQPTTPREAGLAEEEQGAEAPQPEAQAAEARPPAVRRRKVKAGAAEKVEGRRLYLSEDVHFRLRMLAYQRGRKISEVAQEVLDKALPRYDVNRVG